MNILFPPPLAKLATLLFLAALALPAAVHAQGAVAWLGDVQDNCEETCATIGLAALSGTYNSARFPVFIYRSLLPEDYLAEAFCMDARDESGYGCDPDWIVAVKTLGLGAPGHHPPQDGGYYAGRAYLIATQNVGKISKAVEPKTVTFDGTTPGTLSFTCPSHYSGLQANTNYRVMVYAKPYRGRGGGWHKPLAWRDFRTPKHPAANSYCG